MADPRTIPLTAFQSRDVTAWMTQREVIQSSLNGMTRAVIAGADIDPDTLAGARIEITPTAVIITEPSNG